jgi:DNA-binding beta-propeller fold protein YncE
MKTKRMFICIIIVICITAVPAGTYAAEPYKGYKYNEWEEAVPSPNGYAPIKTLDGNDMGIGELRNPNDFFIDEGKNVYILDSGNGRIIVLDSNYKPKKTIDKIYDINTGQEDCIDGASGIFATGGSFIYIADTERNRVLVIDFNGKIIKKITKPQADIYPKDNEFSPHKVIVDKVGNVYVIVAGLYQGAAMFDKNGKFTGFYGSNRIEISVKVIRDFFFKKVMTKEQKENMERYVPVEYTNFDLDRDNFIYTCTARSTETDTNEIRKMNFLGEDVLHGEKYGDIEAEWFKEEYIDTSFVDINVDDEGFINALDYTRGRVFQYDKDGNFMFAFGSKGNQKGTFKYPAAVESLDGKVIVLDSQKANLTVFGLTEFGKYVHEAIMLYNDGMYGEALEPWKEVLKRNINYNLAYVGVGKALFNTENYKEAKKYFRLGSDRKNESKAFKEYRSNIIRNNFNIIFIIAVLITLIIYGIKKRHKVILYISRVFDY